MVSALIITVRSHLLPHHHLLSVAADLLPDWWNIFRPFPGGFAAQLQEPSLAAAAAAESPAGAQTRFPARQIKAEYKPLWL